MLDWHLERRKKLLLKFNTTWPDFGLNWKNRVLRGKAGDRSDVISTPKAERGAVVSSLAAGPCISSSKGSFNTSLAILLNSGFSFEMLDLQSRFQRKEEYLMSTIALSSGAVLMDVVTLRMTSLSAVHMGAWPASERSSSALTLLVLRGPDHSYNTL